MPAWFASLLTRRMLICVVYRFCIGHAALPVAQFAARLAA